QHCQSEHHVNELTGGWTDTPLTELGIQQAKAVAEELCSLGIDKCKLFSSDLKRANMTAGHIAQKLNIQINETSMLREINNGIAAGKTKEWASKNKLYESKTLSIDEPLWKGAETPRELYIRMESFILNILSEDNEDIVIVSHGIAIGYMISVWLKISIENLRNVFIKGNAGGITILTRSDYGQRSLTQFNSMSHLR
ncbi:MAG: histidine phosphatase family protein, partial [Tenericutes bacterium]|nr:histidine phosphatase family protein [Mycoplasmatota bacterium]